MSVCYICTEKTTVTGTENAEKVSIKSTFKRILFTKALATAKYATVCIRSVIFLVIK